MEVFTQDERSILLNKGNILLDNTLFADFFSMEDKEIADLVKAIAKYAGAGEVTNFTENRILKMAFKRFMVSHDANCRKYLASKNRPKNGNK